VSATSLKLLTGNESLRKAYCFPRKKQGAVITKGLPARGFVGVVTNKNTESSILNETAMVLLQL
jgi:hypothetical protein